MAWVCSKILGDGTAMNPFRTQAQQYGLTIRNADHISVDPKTGIPLAGFAMLDIPDDQVEVLRKEPGTFVLPSVDAPLDANSKTEIASGLAAQNCVVDMSSKADVQAVVVDALAKASAK